MKIKENFINIFGGNILTTDILKKNIVFIFFLVVITIIFIGHRYSVMKQMAEIEKYKKELNELKYESLHISSDLTSMSSQSIIESMLQKKGSDLKSPKDEIFIIKKD